MTTPEHEKALNKAKIGLMAKGSVFLTTIAFSLKIQWDTSMPTAYVDGINMGLNPDFFMKATPAQRIFIIAHESWHMALNHILRRGERDPMLYNQAGDYVINQLLHDQNYEMWDWVCQNNKYRDMSTNQVYDDLVQNPPPPSPSSEMGGDIQAMPGNTPEEKIANEMAVKSVLVKAMTQSKMIGEKAGSIPDEITRAIEDLINPILPWEILLDKFMTEQTKDDYTWQRPNRRFAPEFYLPTQYSESLAHLTLAIDTSGSIGDDDLIAILSEIVYIQEKFKPQKLTILDCDMSIHNIHEVKENDDILSLKFSGGGGTSFNPVIDYCKKNKTNALLYFTDLHAREITEKVSFPILWLCYSDHKPAPIGETIYYTPKEVK